MLFGQIAVFSILVAFGAALYWRRARETELKDSMQESGDFMLDLVQEAKKGRLDPIVGMDTVVERVIHVIARKSKNNPLLLGEPGVGKTAVVEALAQRIAAKEVPKAFYNKKLLVLNLGDLMAGTKMRGELEGRLRRLLTSLEEHSREYILFIDEIHMIEQARGSEGSLDMADVLKPALSRGDLQVIGATTYSEYEQYLKPDAAIDRRFQPVLVEEPSRNQAIDILRGVKTTYEDFHGVCIPDQVLKEAVDASMRIIKDRFLPDKAFDVIDEACAKVSIEAGKLHHATHLGVLHAASAHAKNECPVGVPVVSKKDIDEVARQWSKHHVKPRHTQR